MPNNLLIITQATRYYSVVHPDSGFKSILWFLPWESICINSLPAKKSATRFDRTFLFSLRLSIIYSNYNCNSCPNIWMSVYKRSVHPILFNRIELNHKIDSFYHLSKSHQNLFSWIRMQYYGAFAEFITEQFWRP